MHKLISKKPEQICSHSPTVSAANSLKYHIHSNNYSLTPMLSQQDLNLDEIFRNQLQSAHAQQNITYYPMALAVSRTWIVTEHTLSLLQSIFEIQGEKWIQVARRLFENNPTLVIQAYLNYLPMYPAFADGVLRLRMKDSTLILQNILAIINNKVADEPLVIAVYESLKLILDEIYFDESREQAVGYSDDLKYNLINVSLLEFLKDRQYLGSKSYLQIMIHVVRRFVESARRLVNQSALTQTFRSLMSAVIPRLMETPTETGLHVLMQACQCGQIYSIIQGYSQHLIYRICLPNLVNYNREVGTKANQDAEEVVNYETDITSHRMSETMESCAVELLVRLCDYIDGALSRLLRQITSTMQRILSGKLGEKSELFTNLPPSQEIELCYLLLAILHKSLNSREDLLEELSELLQSYSRQIFQIQSNVVLDFRTVKLTELYAPCMKPGDFEQAMLFFMKYLKQTTVNRSESVLTYQIYTSLQNILDNKDLYQRFEYCIVELASILNSILEVSDNPKFFEILKAFIQDFQVYVDRYSVSLVKSLTGRIHQQIRKCKSQKATHSQLINKLFECLNKIFLHKGIIEDMYYEFEDTLNDLPQYLANVTEIDFQDKILDIGATIMDKLEECTCYVSNCFTYLKSIFGKAKDLSGSLFEFMYACAKRIPNYCLDNPQIVVILTEMCIDEIKYLDPKSLYINTVRQNLQQSLLLAQTIVQSFQDYYREHNLELLGTLAQVGISLRTGLEMHNQPQLEQLDELLITIFYIKPFDLTLQPIQSRSKYYNKLFLIYYIVRLSFRNYTQETLHEFLNFIKFYMVLYLPKSALSPQQNSRMEEQDPSYLMKETNQFCNRISPPFKSELDEISFSQQIINNMIKRKNIDLYELNKQDEQTLNTFRQLKMCGNVPRKIFRFSKMKQ